MKHSELDAHNHCITISWCPAYPATLLWLAQVNRLRVEATTRMLATLIYGDSPIVVVVQKSLLHTPSVPDAGRGRHLYMTQAYVLSAAGIAC